MKKKNEGFELRLRGMAQNNYSKNRDNKNENKTVRQADKIINKSIVCIVILIIVMFLKISNFTFADTITGKLKYLIAQQTDFTDSAELVAERISSLIKNITGNEMTVSGEVSDTIVAPLATGEISYTFGETVHPVFNTTVEPTGIGIKSTSQAFVYAGCDGTISSISQNGDSTLRVVIDGGGGIMLVYDNLGMTYFGIGDAVAAKQIIGMLTQSEDAMLIFEVWKNGTAQDPVTYLGDIY